MAYLPAAAAADSSNSDLPSFEIGMFSVSVLEPSFSLFRVNFKSTESLPQHKSLSMKSSTEPLSKRRTLLSVRVKRSA